MYVSHSFHVRRIFLTHNYFLSLTSNAKIHFAKCLCNIHKFYQVEEYLPWRSRWGPSRCDVVRAKGRKVKIVRIKGVVARLIDVSLKYTNIELINWISVRFHISGTTCDQFVSYLQLVSRSETLSRRSDDENFVAAGRGAGLALRYLAVPALKKLWTFGILSWMG